MDTISIIVPVYQNELNIHKCVEALVKLNVSCNKLGYELEMIFVEDGSTDGSYTILKDYLHIRNLSIIKLTRNFGQIPAIQAGIERATGIYLGIISADLQDPPELFLEMIPFLEKDFKLVVAERGSRNEGYCKIFTSRLYWWLIKRFSMRDFPDGGFDFCMFDKQVASEINRIYEKNTNIFPLIYWLGFKPKIIKYTRKSRDEGESTWGFFKKIKLTIDTIIGFTYIPTRLISISAILTSVIAFVHSLYILLMWYFGYSESPDGWTTITMLILIIGGMILFSLGIISEYLLRILDEARGRPNFVIDKVKMNKSSK